jgi:hypothetical protein
LWPRHGCQRCTATSPAAADTLAEALTLACQQARCGVFADEGPTLRALLGRAIAARQAGQPSVRGIAEELFVTLFTVKKHVSHIPAKLGAANRTEAVARARQLGLIP